MRRSLTPADQRAPSWIGKQRPVNTTNSLKFVSNSRTVLSLERKLSWLSSTARILSVAEPLPWGTAEPLPWGTTEPRMATTTFQSPPPSHPSSSPGCQNFPLQGKHIRIARSEICSLPSLGWFLPMGCYYSQSIKLSASRLFTVLLSSQSCRYVATPNLVALMHTFSHLSPRDPLSADGS